QRIAAQTLQVTALDNPTAAIAAAVGIDLVRGGLAGLEDDQVAGSSQFAAQEDAARVLLGAAAVVAASENRLGGHEDAASDDELGGIARIENAAVEDQAWIAAHSREVGDARRNSREIRAAAFEAYIGVAVHGERVAGEGYQPVESG